MDVPQKLNMVVKLRISSYFWFKVEHVGLQKDKGNMPRHCPLFV